jgi:hypothetical protein
MAGIAVAALLREVRQQQYGGGGSTVAAAVQRRRQRGSSSIATAAVWQGSGSAAVAAAQEAHRAAQGYCSGCGRGPHRQGGSMAAALGVVAAGFATVQKRGWDLS